MLCISLITFSCKKERKIQIHQVTVQLAYPTGSQFAVTADVLVKMNGKGTSFEAKTDASGKAVFSVPTDIYEVSASDTRSAAGKAYNYNALATGVAIVDNRDAAEIVKLELKESKTSQLVIKEVYIGGVPTDNGSSSFTFDGYVTIYNNSDIPANTGNLCIGAIGPANTQATNNFYVDNKLIYENEAWMPAISGYWYFQQNIVIEPHKQLVVALYNAVDNTKTHSKSINFDNPAYYVTYDIASQYKHASYYVSPAASIPSSHYLKAVTYAAGTAWTPSVTSPGIVLFETKGTTPVDFGADATNIVLSSSKKLPVDWIVDGIESFKLDETTNRKRFLPTVDAGYVLHTNRLGYSIYRNVDEAATKAIAGNEAKLVKNYQNGTVNVGGTTDPSGIDAEASIKNGATIIYKDTNNSTSDVHLRAKAALRTN